VHVRVDVELTDGSIYRRDSEMRAHARHTFNVGAVRGRGHSRELGNEIQMLVVGVPPFVPARLFDTGSGRKASTLRQWWCCLLHTLRVWMRGAAGTSAFVSPTCCKVGCVCRRLGLAHCVVLFISCLMERSVRTC
jgi:hypothetical protein